MKKEQKPGLLRPSQGRERGLPENIQKILSNLPKNPGVYQMKDKDGIVIYVGKAKNLSSRVKSYFDRTNELTAAKKQMVSRIVDIEMILCSTEVEALVLETNLIKHLTPKYNILMKDDKNLAYLKITNSPVPELIKTRQKIRDGGEYFGPYVSGVEQSVRALRRILRIRNCRVKFQNMCSGIEVTDKAGKTLPCMDYYIGLCPAPCMLQESKISEHNANIERARQFLSLGGVDVLSSLETEMRERAQHMEFEKAQEIKETIAALRGLSERQSVRDVIDGDVDIFLMYEKYEKTYIVFTQIRRSQIIGVWRHEVVVGAEDRVDVMTGFLMKQYIGDDGEGDIPDTLLLREEIQDEAFLTFLREKKIQVEYPQIGPKNDIIEFSLTQIREYAYKREMEKLENKTLNREHMKNVLTELGYPIPAKGEIVFECYDISHTDGHFTYASRVCIVDGKPDTKRYKKYKIKTLLDGDIDDYASHREVMIRRTLEGLEQGNFPHLIIIDGGKGQLSSAVSGVKEGIWKFRHSEKTNLSEGGREATLGCEGRVHVSENGTTGSFVPQDNGDTTNVGLPPLCSIAKREEEIFLPGEKNPVLFEKGTPELMVLQKARDESHRFSITANKTARMKSMKKNILEEIPGIGPVTRKKLLKLAGSVNGIKVLSEEVLNSVCNSRQIETLRDHGII